MPVYKGIEHLDKIATSASVCFDTETLQLQPAHLKKCVCFKSAQLPQTQLF